MGTLTQKASLHRPALAYDHSWRSWGIRIGIALLLVLAALYVRQNLLVDGAHPYKRVQRVALVASANRQPVKEIKPKEESPKELERKQELSVLEQAEAAPKADRPQDDQLGVDADGEGAGDGFGLMAKRGGRDITTIGPEGDGGNGQDVGSGIARFNYGVYAGTIRQRLQGEFMDHDELRSEDYVVVFLLWINARGRIERVELPKPSGSQHIDSALRQVLGNMPVLPEPPVGLPQPLKLRMTSKGSGHANVE